jgi:hypothetical protein|tara:strand:- start:496 stop:813 length:318 start_codon:yes stop_codon:yes gene_type:complete
MDSNYYDINTAGGMTGGIDTSTGEFQIHQDAAPFIAQAKADREGSRVKGKDIAYKKACTIPDIVALDILTKYKIDIHDANFMHDSRAVRKVIAIMKSEYPALMSY